MNQKQLSKDKEFAQDLNIDIEHIDNYRAEYKYINERINC